MAALLTSPDDGDTSIARDVIDAMSARSAHQGVVFTSADVGALAVCESVDDGSHQLIVVRMTPGADAADLEADFDAMLAESRAAKELAIDDADVSVTDGTLVASIPITGDAAVMAMILQTNDVLLRWDAPD